jgi:hypothetical protein
MNGHWLLSGLELHNQTALHEQIDRQAPIEPHALEVEGYGLLAFDPEAPALEIASQDGFIDSLEEAGAQPRVQFVG